MSRWVGLFIGLLCLEIVQSCVPLSVDMCISLQHFLCFSCRVPADVGGSLKPGAFPTYQPGAKEMKGEPESPLMGSPTPSPDSPARSSCQPNSPAESNTCSKNLVVSSKTIQTSSFDLIRTEVN